MTDDPKYWEAYDRARRKRLDIVKYVPPVEQRKSRMQELIDQCEVKPAPPKVKDYESFSAEDIAWLKILEVGV